ncbi:hypothetical protein LSGJ_01422 [Ligilactobacillus salivarius GJ-24]|uniref:Uncharacterized protein n=1 Tax=Ligilactobacillus salivarius GJ-24 TaxID=1041521 RepID=F7QV61_9LACO|nr:hypothetical protein LSGJ_01422 [Ligilactobacillus salivarius GJ-24]
MKGRDLMENNISLLELKIINESQSDADPYFKLKENGIESKIITTLNITNDPFIGNSNRVVFITIAGINDENAVYLSREYVQITNPNEPFTIYSAVDIDKKYLLDDNGNLKYKDVVVSFAYTSKLPGEMGISESIRVGTFFKTNVPILDERKK